MKITTNLHNINQNNNLCKQNVKACFVKSRPSFDGKMNIKRNFFEKILSFFKKIIWPTTPPPQAIVSQSVIKHELPFDAIQRLKHNKIREDHFQMFLDTANQNQAHFGYLMKMKKAGIDEQEICEIFNNCKNDGGQLKTPLYNAALFLKGRDIKSNHIKTVLLNFRQTFNKFDYAAFDDYIQLRDKVVNKKSKIKGAFCDMPEAAINEFFFKNLKTIRNVSKIVGHDTFLGFTELEPKMFFSAIKEIHFRSRVKIAKKNIRTFPNNTNLPYS